MKDPIKYGLYGVLLILVLFFVTRACSISDKYAQLKGTYETYRVLAKADNAIAKKTIEEQTKKIGQLTKDIADSEKVVESKKKDVQQLDGKVKDLEAKYALLEDKDAKIENLTEQVGVWQSKFSLAMEMVAEQDKVIFSLKEKYNAQLDISGEYKGMYEREVSLHKISRDLLSMAENKLRARGLFSNVKSVAVVALGGYIVYTLVRR